MSQQPQTFANHVQYDPTFHFFVLPAALITFIIAGVQFFRFPSFLAGWLVIAALAAMFAVLRIRNYALRIQDRVIRLEERFRLSSVLPEPLRARIGELSDKQLVGLRFAPDAELPALVQRALDERLGLRDIKKAIVNWRPDNSRV